MKITFIFMYWISAVNARRSSGRSGSSSRSKSRLNSREDDGHTGVNTNSKVNPSLIGPSSDAKPISVSHPNCYMYISCRKKLPGHIFQQKKDKKREIKKDKEKLNQNTNKISDPSQIITLQSKRYPTERKSILEHN